MNDLQFDYRHAMQRLQPIEFPLADVCHWFRRLHANDADMLNNLNYIACFALGMLGVSLLLWSLF